MTSKIIKFPAPDRDMADCPVIRHTPCLTELLQELNSALFLLLMHTHTDPDLSPDVVNAILTADSIFDEVAVEIGRQKRAVHQPPE